MAPLNERLVMSLELHAPELEPEGGRAREAPADKRAGNR